MDITLLLIALGLAMDAFSVSVTNGLCGKNIGIKQALLIGVFFGGAQAIMPTVGYYAGNIFAGYIESVDHWIAFFLLGIIGLKMILEARDKMKAPQKCDEKSLTVKMLFFQAIATSIDALAVGISFAALKINIAAAAAEIGLVTFLLSVIGVFIGKKAGGLFKEKAEIIGGVILILIGIKILAEHLFVG
uniref:Putative manganese efflux pump MntP n=1 Tax=uncultured Bacillota bacterium TaxID=344338 RepID=A0A650EN84_9FIRM|nr:putative manganese efflux pump MntP [uncultured Firmicutes bacterium]